LLALILRVSFILTLDNSVSDLGLKDEVEYITDISKIIEMGVMQSPVLAINGKPVMVGFTPDVEKIKEIIQENIK
jgi:glutaredoxin